MLSDSAVSRTVYWYVTMIAQLVVHSSFQELVFFSVLIFRVGAVE